MNVQPDHVHLVVMAPPKVSISELLGRLKGQSSMRMFQQFRHLKKKPYWGNHIWAKGYCVDTAGCASIRKFWDTEVEKGKAKVVPNPYFLPSDARSDWYSMESDNSFQGCIENSNGSYVISMSSPNRSLLFPLVLNFIR